MNIDARSRRSTMIQGEDPVVVRDVRAEGLFEDHGRGCVNGPGDRPGERPWRCRKCGSPRGWFREKLYCSGWVTTRGPEGSLTTEPCVYHGAHEAIHYVCLCGWTWAEPVYDRRPVEPPVFPPEGTWMSELRPWWAMIAITVAVAVAVGLIVLWIDGRP